MTAAADQLIAEANASPVLQKVYVEGLPPGPQVNLMIDREKAGAFGVTFEDINNTISTSLGSTYVNDFPNRGRMQRVVVQADRISRMNVDDILNYSVKNARGQLVPCADGLLPSPLRGGERTARAARMGLSLRGWSSRPSACMIRRHVAVTACRWCLENLLSRSCWRAAAFALPRLTPSRAP